MSGEELQDYINGRLKELKAGNDMQDAVYKGKLSFGISSTEYSHLPAWEELTKQSKKLRKLFWLSAYFAAFMAVFVTGNYFERYSWQKAVFMLIVGSVIVALFINAIYYFSFFIQVRRTEREVRKLIYQDILDKLEKEENVAF